MEFIRISSKSNAALKHISSLQTSGKYRKKSREFVIEGLRICEDAAQNGIEFSEVFISDSFNLKADKRSNEILKKAEKIYILSDELFLKIADTKTPQGIIAAVKYPEKSCSDVLSGRYAALIDLQDPSNIGAIARSAEALGIDGLIISGGCDPYSPKVLRASMGTILRIPVYLTDDILSFADRSELRLFACVPDKNAENICNVKFNNKDVIMIGNEGNGLDETLINAAFKKITIPMKGKAESLNAAAAAAISMWEMMR